MQRDIVDIILWSSSQKKRRKEENESTIQQNFENLQKKIHGIIKNIKCISSEYGNSSRKIEAQNIKKDNKSPIMMENANEQCILKKLTTKNIFYYTG